MNNLINDESIKSLKILCLTSSFPKSAIDPAGFFVYQLVDALMKKGMKITVLTPDSNQASNGWQNSCTVHRFTYAPKKWQTLAQLPGGIPAALKHDWKNYFLVPLFLISFAWNIIALSKKFDLILANWTVCGALASYLIPFHRKPIITVLRGSDVRKNTSASGSYLLNITLKSSTAVVCVGEDMKKRLTENDPYPENIFFIPNGIHESFFFLDLPKPKKNINILFAGSFTPDKGVDILLKAIYKIRDKRIHLFVVGQGMMEHKLKNMTKQLAIEDWVTFKGQIPPGVPMAEMMRKAHIFVLPSYHEGRSNVVVEAMASGRPVIASNIDGITELITKSAAGSLFIAGNADSLTEAILKLINNPDDLAAIGKSGRDWVLHQQLNWDNTARKYIKLFHSIMTLSETNK